jgi:hypothetical protein
MFEINYKNTFEGIINNIIKCNPDDLFDIYAHGWAPKKIEEDIVTELRKVHNVNNISIELEPQLDFGDVYTQINNKSYFLNDIAKYHSHYKMNKNNNQYICHHFQNILS